MASAGSWTGAYDSVSFIAPIRAAKEDLLRRLKRPRLDADAAKAMLAELGAIDRFVKAITKINGPSADLVPVAGVALQSGDLYVLQVGAWRAYYLLHHRHQAFYGVLVTHRSVPVAARLNELRVPQGPARAEG